MSSTKIFFIKNMENIPARQMPIQISSEEVEIINDIRRVDFGKVILSIQNGVIVNKEVSIITKFSKCKNNNGNSENNFSKTRQIAGMNTQTMRQFF